MARSVYLISLASNAVEGGRLTKDSSHPDLPSRLFSPPEGEEIGEAHILQSLDAFTEGFPENRTPTILILPTSAVSLRRLEFKFGDTKKIRQVIPLQLENELLESLSLYSYDFEVLFSEKDRGEVMVYLVDRQFLDKVVEITDRRKIHLERVTFSAHVLAQLMGREGIRQCLVYVGSDEAYIAETYSGRLVEVNRLNAWPGRVLAEMEPLHLDRPQDMLNALFNGGEGVVNRETLLKDLTGELENIREEANRFIRIKSGGEAPEITVHGLFDRCFEVLPETGELRLRPEPDDTRRNVERPFLGILHQVFQHADNPLSTKGLNFFKRVGAWLPAVSGLKGSFAVTLTLLLVMAGIAAGGFFWRTASLQRQLTGVDAQLKQRLKITLPVSSFLIRNALLRLEERLKSLKKKSEASVIFDQYHYGTLLLFKELSALIGVDGNLSVDSLSFNRNRFSMAGSAENFNAPEKLKNQIAAMERFRGQSVKITTSGSTKAIRYRISVER